MDRQNPTPPTPNNQCHKPCKDELKDIEQPAEDQATEADSIGQVSLLDDVKVKDADISKVVVVDCKVAIDDDVAAEFNQNQH